MIIAKFIGGLGNQMFQYAAGRAVSVRSGTEFKTDISGYDNQSDLITPRSYELASFRIQENFATVEDIIRMTGRLASTPVGLVGRLKRKLFGDGARFKTGHQINELGFEFCDDLLKVRNEAYLNGYWQSEKYFKDIESTIRQEFALKDEYSVENTKLAQEIKGLNSVSLHIRRGDYVTDERTNKYHGTCSLEYYAQAIKYVADKVADIHVYVFSDDIEWVKQNLRVGHSATYVSDGTFNNVQEMILMSYSQHNIIANSSFSWWGAWLNDNPDKIVIAPKKWFNEGDKDTKDLIPESWIRL